ncbi:MAG: DUF6524 family protein [Sedimenticola sp.]|nr:DUF6524 family protein [Sedimenticola sp.]
MAYSSFNFSSFMIRWVLALVLVFATYNPSGYSWYHWLQGAENKLNPMIALAAVALIIGWVIYLRATTRSLGVVGTVLAVAFFGTLVWALVYYNLISLDNTTLLTYIVLVILSAVMGIGLSWSHIRRRLSGQLDVDDRDEE